MRGLKDRIVDELNGGKLAWFLTEVKGNPKLKLAIRENFLHIYYRGAETLKIEMSAGFKFTTLEKYFFTPELAEEYAPLQRDARAQALYQRKFPTLTGAVDAWTATNHRDTQEKQQELASSNSHIVDMNFLTLGSDTACDLVGVAEGKVVLSPFFKGVDKLSGAAAQYTAAAALLEKDSDSLTTGMTNIMTNYVSLGLMTEVLPCDGAPELVFILVDCDKAAATQALQAVKGSVPYKVLFLSDADQVIDYSKAESL